MGSDAAYLSMYNYTHAICYLHINHTDSLHQHPPDAMLQVEGRRDAEDCGADRAAAGEGPHQREGGILALLEIEYVITEIALSTNFSFQILHILQCCIVPIYPHFKDHFRELGARGGHVADLGELSCIGSFSKLLQLLQVLFFLMLDVH